MKHIKKIFAIFMAMAILCSAAAGVSGTGVTFTKQYLFGLGLAYLGDDGNYTYYEPSDELYSEINDWLINTPYWAVDVFAPGYSTSNLCNDPKADGKTIDFEVPPYEGFKDTVIVADIPEEYREVYNEFVSSERKTDPTATLEVSNIVRKKNCLILDYTATGDFGSKFDEMGIDIINPLNLKLYGVTTDKQTGEIIRYDHVTSFWISTGDGDYYPVDSVRYPFEDPNVEGAEIPFPRDFDPEKHEYGLCFIAFDKFDSWMYDGEVCIYNYTKIDVPEPTIIYGDANGNGNVALTDLIYARRKLAGGKGRINWDADMDDDGAMTLTDCAMLARLLLSQGK